MFIAYVAVLRPFPLSQVGRRAFAWIERSLLRRIVTNTTFYIDTHTGWLILYTSAILELDHSPDF
jgi:hypothetical protein